MALRASRRLFTVWHWFAVPLLLGAFVIAFVTNAYIGLLWSILFAVWFWDSGETTCSRCSSYGSLNCGVQGKIIPLFWKRRSPASASRRRIRFHYYLDLLMIAAMNAVYCLEPIFLPIVLIWTLGAWLISLGPKRFHGLLFRLRESESTESMRISLTIVVNPTTKEVPRPTSLANPPKE
jgi:hypothetical protein